MSDRPLTLAGPGPDGQTFTLNRADTMGLSVLKAPDAAGEVRNLGGTQKEADWTIKVHKAAVPVSLEQLEDILVLVHYKVEMPNNP